MSAQEQMESLREYLRRVADVARWTRAPTGYKYCCIEELLLAEGREFSGEPYTHEEENMILRLMEIHGRHLQTRECYKNALMGAIAADAMKLPFYYAEGMAIGVIPVNHAWLVLNHKPVDFTWRDLKEKVRDRRGLLRRLKDNLAANAYIGIVVPTTVVTERAIATSHAPVMLDDWEGRWPLLRDGVPAEWKQQGGKK